MTSPYTLEDFDFVLPPELIAQHPLAERSASKLLDARGVTPSDRVFRELPALLHEGDLLVFNDTRVIKARLLGFKASGGAVEALVERVLPQREAIAQLRASKAPRAGSRLRFEDAFDVEVLRRSIACASRTTRCCCSRATAMYLCRPTSNTPPVPTTKAAIRRSSPRHPARWRPRPRPCTSMRRCSLP